MITYLLVLLGMVLNVGAQVALKYATQGSTTLSLSGVMAEPARFLLNAWFLAGLVLYAVSVLNWLIVLGRMELSVAYPLMSLGYILTLLIGAWLFHEPVTVVRVVGVLVIILGVVLITRPAGVAVHV
jgi:multidrug transporter EmrE-like cation transporter